MFYVNKFPILPMNEIESNNFNNKTHNKTHNKKRKKVDFQNIIKVVLIPKYKDICDCRDLWWNEFDRRIATIFMNNEITTLMRIHPGMTSKQAMKLLYQPNNIRYYDPNNFI
jgi:hypothetical protein